MSNLTAESAYQKLAEFATKFAPDPGWKQLRLDIEMYEKSVSHTGHCYSEDGSESYFVIPPNQSDGFSDACFFLRNNLKATQGTEAYGLDFVLKRDGKFTIKYNYDRPEEP